MAKRRIDANQMLKNIELLARHEDTFRRSVILGVAQTIRNAPTIDAIEIVRCKDCKYWEKQKDSAKGCCLLSGNYPTGGWYCADGKRRDEGG